MKTLYIVSSEPYAGKGWITLMLGMKFKEKRIKLSYFRPLGTLPMKIGEILTDEDAVYFNQTLRLGVDENLLSPVVITDKFMEQAIAKQIYKTSKSDSFTKKILNVYKKISVGKQLLLVGGAGSLFTTGTSLNLSTSNIAELIDARVLVITKYNPYMVDSIVASKQVLKEKMLGVAINSIPQEKLVLVKENLIPYFKKNNITVLGNIPYDRILSSVSIKELVDNLSAEIICGENKLDNLVENFCVGAMNIDAALKYFRQIPNKAVITGGDRADLQLSALETPTVCLILTGNLYPSSAIIGKAECAGVPILLVKYDTLSTVERIDNLLTRIPVRGKKKLNQAKKLFDKHFDFKKLCSMLDLK